ncbi:uncharacterized protein LOC134527749 [Bacillus rossius redtenbacheri]|uniref:uncharacterized protein LOC134527749 n=1 Tax=Bacillus rossius redtenbacheri TaxID=93214 RepID=UPI002FDC9B65
MDIPFMSYNKFRKQEEVAGKTWEEQLYLELKKNGAKEREIALEKNHTKDGVPYIAVLGDGGWAKRSYGHGFSSTAGVGVIIGMETNKLLYLGIRNSFCFLCARSKTERKTVPPHTCYKNYTGPATGMEQSIIVEGFNKSVEQHGLVYLNYLGDGESSVFARIQEQVSYGRYVQKIECSNHMTRAFSDGLHKLARNTLYPLEGRRILTENVEGVSRLERLVKGVRTAIKSAAALDDKAEACAVLRTDVANALNHVCGRHEQCRDFCKRKNSAERDVLGILESTNLANPIMTLLDRIIRNADRLTLNVTTNQAERCVC